MKPVKEDPTADPKANPVSLFWSSVGTRASRVPVTAWVFLGLLLMAGTFAAVHTAMTAKDATLRLKVQHSLRSAQLSVWIDGDLAYSNKLTGTAKKKFGLITEPVQGSLSETLPITSGMHQVRVQTTQGSSAQGSFTREDTISGNFASHSQRTLSVTARPSDVALSWQAGSGALAESSVADTGGWQRYTSALLLTAAGSIISALAGFAIKELPKHIVARQTAAPKM